MYARESKHLKIWQSKSKFFLALLLHEFVKDKCYSKYADLEEFFLLDLSEGSSVAPCKFFFAASKQTLTKFNYLVSIIQYNL
jgi:hypothetical protein